MLKIISGMKFEAAPGGRKYPFAEMAVNDFFEVPDHYRPENVANAAHRWGSAKGRKFRIQRLEDGKVRIWRVK